MLSNPGRRTTYPGYGLNYNPVVNYLNQNIPLLLSGVTVGASSTTSAGTPGIVNILTNGTPANNIYQNLNVDNTSTISNYNTFSNTFVATNSNTIMNANYLDEVFIAYDNSVSFNYSNVFPNLEVVYGYLGIAVGQFSNGDGAVSLDPTLGNTPGSSNVNPINIDDFPALREVVGDIVILTDYMSSVPTFASLERCNSLTIYLNNSSNVNPLQITRDHFPRLQHVQRFIRIINLQQCTMISGFVSLSSIGSMYDPIANPENVLPFLSPAVTSYDTYNTSYQINSVYDSDGIYIVNNGAAGTGITEMNIFHALTVVNGHIDISGNTFNPVGINNTLYAFTILGYCQGIFIGKTALVNVNLQQIIGFFNLTTVGFINILDGNTPTLYRINGFMGVEHVNSVINIGSSLNPTSKLSYIDGFQKMQSADIVTIYANKTTSILALANINSVSNSTIITTYN